MAAKPCEYICGPPAERSPLRSLMADQPIDGLRDVGFIRAFALMGLARGQKRQQPHRRSGGVGILNRRRARRRFFRDSGNCRCSNFRRSIDAGRASRRARRRRVRSVSFRRRARPCASPAPWPRPPKPMPSPLCRNPVPIPFASPLRLCRSRPVPSRGPEMLIPNPPDAGLGCRCRCRPLPSRTACRNRRI